MTTLMQKHAPIVHSHGRLLAPYWESMRLHKIRKELSVLEWEIPQITNKYLKAYKLLQAKHLRDELRPYLIRKY